MTPQELAVAVKETLLDEKQKKIPFQSFCKKTDIVSLIKYIIKYGELDTEGIGKIEKEIKEIKDEVKLRDIEIWEQKKKEAEEILKKLKS